ncbi:uncharacterized protein LOC122757519 [Drosophila mojavensis]|uniref:uncharacterized protein LOC122757518 n=1 Tax=Drosophila mojavensis TaxID=7230 RepID=UPI001CD046BC|nr:uncharacterized protein LOC122757518 [Drosophila mojavensis]XP_043865771.1 uncharacterized protein LOC122757519 [Drosophila mojavensis]
MLCVVAFWLHFLTGNVKSLYVIFRATLVMSNMMHNIWMARSIEAAERQVLNQMYQHDMLIPLKHQNPARRRRLVKLTQIYLKRCTKREQTPSIYNYIHISRSLNVFIINVVVSNAFLMIMFSIKYERRYEIFSEHHQLHTANDLTLKIMHNMAQL